MKYMRITAGYTWTDYKTNEKNYKGLKITQILDNLLEYKRNLIQYVNRMSHNRLPRVMKHYSPTGRRNYGSESWTIKARDPRRIKAAEMKYMRRTAGYTWTDYKTNEKKLQTN